MNVNRRLVLLGVMLIVLSMTMATQYATTKVGYTYSIVHPSNADIRFIGCDNSTDGVRVLRTESALNTSGNLNLQVRLGNWSENQNKTYTMAFAIVNEEPFPVNITNAWIDHTAGSDYMKIWLHGRSYQLAHEDETSVKIWDGDANPRDEGYTNSSNIWTLAAGDGNPQTINGSVHQTHFDNNAHVRYLTLNNGTSYDTWATSTVSDFVWIQISIDIPDGAETAAAVTGTMVFNFESTTIT